MSSDFLSIEDINIIYHLLEHVSIISSEWDDLLELKTISDSSKEEDKRGYLNNDKIVSQLWGHPPKGPGSDDDTGAVMILKVVPCSVEQEAEVIQPLTEAKQAELEFFKEVYLSPLMDFPEFSIPIGNAEEHLEVLRICEGPQRYLENGLFYALETLLESMQPYPGDLTNILQH
ncbi:hypothetical protein H2248_006816 [Termitomyces sp. 'cryptogamus']|nr:hypothetical protein H2248_006816 [Termitomyces sp. 'cryptogamus']